jgi:hypothetical protein
MPTRPSAPYLWATNPGRRTVPTLARQGTGWVMGDPVDPLQVNDLWGACFDWIGYLAGIVPSSNVLVAETFRVVDPAGPTTRGALTWTTIGGNAGLVVGGNAGGSPGIFFDNATGFVKVLQSTGPVVMLEVQPTGMVGPKAIADAVYGARFQYDSTDLLELEHDFSPSGGGYTPIVVTPFVGAGLPASLVNVGTSHLLYNPNAVPQDASFRRPLIIPYPTEATGPSLMPKLISITATFIGATNDLKVRVIRVTRSSGAESIRCTLDAANPTFTFAGTGENTDPEFMHYVVELYSAALGAGLPTADALRTVTIVAKHGRLNPIL